MKAVIYARFSSDRQSETSAPGVDDARIKSWLENIREAAGTSKVFIDRIEVDDGITIYSTFGNILSGPPQPILPALLWSKKI